MPRTAHEVITENRRRKARRIYDALRDGGITLRQVQTFGDLQWSFAAQLAGYDSTSEETRNLILAFFVRPPAEMERIRERTSV